MFGSRTVYSPDQVALLQQAFDAAMAQAAQSGKLIVHDELARRLMAAMAEGEDSADALARKALHKCGRKAFA